MYFIQGKHRKIHSFKIPSYWHIQYFLYHKTHFFLENVVQNFHVPCGQNYSTIFIQHMRVGPLHVLLEVLLYSQETAEQKYVNICRKY